MAASKIIREKDIISKTDERGLGAFFFYAGDKHGDKVAQVCSVTGQAETFRRVKERSTRVAIEMRKRGIKQNDVVVLCSKNTLNSTIPMLAAQYLGAKTAALDPTLSIADTTHLLGIVKPAMLIISEESVYLIEESLKKHTFKTEIVVNGKSTKYSQLVDFETCKQDEHLFTPVQIKNPKDETGIIFFSSGTTGYPKGICVTHFGILYSTESLLNFGIDARVMLHYSSLYWNTAVLILILSYLTGGRRVVCGEFNGDITAKIIQDQKVTFIFMAPGYTYKLNKSNTGYDTSSLKSLILGGCPISKEQLLRTKELFPHSKVFQGYGMTEASGFITCFNSDEDAKFIDSKPLSSGRPIAGMSIKVVNPDTEELLGPNQKGEIRVYTKSLTVGYYSQDFSGVLDSEGYLLTGDIGYYDEDGFVFIVDRIKEMFKFQSWHIVPTVLEAVIMEHPAVSEVAVFGIPHEEDGDHPAAAVVIKNQHLGKVKQEDIQKFVDEHVLDRQRLRGGVYFVDNINKTPSGKVKRREVREYIIKNKSLITCK